MGSAEFFGDRRGEGALGILEAQSLMNHPGPSLPRSSTGQGERAPGRGTCLKARALESGMAGKLGKLLQLLESISVL